jgi:hypothetical protein
MDSNQLKELIGHLQDVWSLSEAEAKDLLTPVCEVFRERGVVSIEVDYSGWDDEGAIDEIRLHPEGTVVPQDLLDLIEGWVTSTLPEAWEVNDGSQGSVTIDVAAVTAHFDHEMNYVATKDDSFDIGGE